MLSYKAGWSFGLCILRSFCSGVITNMLPKRADQQTVCRSVEFNMVLALYKGRKSISY